MIPIKLGRLAWVNKDHVASEMISALRNTFTLATEESDYSDKSYIIAYEENLQYFGFPREAVSQVFRGIDYCIEDETTLNEPVKFKVKERPWDQQRVPVKEAVEILKRDGGTILQAPCGSGKTNMALYITAALKQPTLILVNKGFLAEQWIERAEGVLGITPGIIQQDKCEYEGSLISVGTVQSISSREYPVEMYKHFGLVIVDECHRLGCRSYDMAMRKFPGKYRLGLTATPRRKDGMECLFFWHIGPIGTELEAKPKKGRVYQFRLKSSVNMKKFEWEGRLNFSRMITALTNLDHRQIFLTNEILKLAKEGRKILVISDRKKHLKDFELRLKAKGFKDIGYYVGAMSWEDLKESKKKAVILGTYQMALEGLDIPTLDTIVLTTPKSDIEQAVGRVLRVGKGKKVPLVVDIIDPTPILMQMARKRARQYEEGSAMQFTVNQINL